MRWTNNRGFFFFFFFLSLYAFPPKGALGYEAYLLKKTSDAGGIREIVGLSWVISSRQDGHG